MSDEGKPWQGYAAEAVEGTLFDRYERLSSHALTAPFAHLLPTEPSRVLDIGAGTGRDAAWFASLGHTVVAAEPVEALRTFAEATHDSPRITWIEDSLPDIPAILALGATYDLVWLSAVWMHLDDDERITGFPVLAKLLSPGGLLVFYLRHGPVPDGRRMFEVTADETKGFALGMDLECIYEAETDALQPENQREGVRWTRLVFRKPHPAA
ncbi:MAG: class I SAM-dependent methyltransferase [Pseudomonadota bacterium]